MRKNYTLNLIKCLLVVVMCTFSQTLSAQFTVHAAVTDETCPGHGSLMLSVQNASGPEPVNYKVYLLPETDFPFWNSADPYVPALQDGTYLVVATQEVNGNTVTDSIEATINSLYVPIEFSISSVNAVCGNDGSMVIAVTQGTAATYEILDGPVTAGPQASNVFNGLPAGTYEVRVVDNCGNGFVDTQTFFIEQPILSLAGPSFPDTQLPSCSQINIAFSVTPQNSGIIYPLTVQYTVHPPGGGAAVVYNQTISTGDPSQATLARQIPYYNTPYTVDLQVTDPCGTVYTLNNNTVDVDLAAAASTQLIECGTQLFTVNTTKFVAPYTIAFTETPAGFNPALYNPNYPGPYNLPAITFGTEENPVPTGMYGFTVTDACGRTSTVQLNVEIPALPVPAPGASNHDCVNALGEFTLSMAGYPLQTATITSAPANYSHPVPYDATALIASGSLTVDGMPEGNYACSVTDICGNTYDNIAIEIPAYSPLEPTYRVRPDCEPGKGSVRISSDCTSVIMTGAPAGFGQSMPYDVSFNISDQGLFSMDNLLPGT